jgi:hypothetical protein
MKHERWWSVRLACRMGGESRAAELKIRADTINPDLWQLQPDGSYRHAQLEAFALQWLANQCELRIWTNDGAAGLPLFAVRTPAESHKPDVQTATEATRNTTARTHSRQLCRRCNGELSEPLEERQQRLDAWRE